MRNDDYKNLHSDYYRTVMALKAARLQKGISRKDAAKLLGWSPISFEQIENARCNFSEARLHKIISAFGYTLEEFEQIKRDPKRIIAQACEQKPKEQNVERKPRRNHYRIITKEVRVLRVLRSRKGYSQAEASRLCGYCPGAYGQIECGRIELGKERIHHIIESFGYEWSDFEELLKTPVLRDEVLKECIEILHKLDDVKLESAKTIIKALQK